MIDISYGRRQRGFSLLEVLVAFSVMALVLGVVFRILSSGMNTAELTGRYSQAALLAQSRMAELDAQDDLQEGRSEGEFADSDYRWQLTVSAYNGEPTLNLDQLTFRPLAVELEVHWGDGDQSRSINLSTLRLAPKL